MGTKKPEIRQQCRSPPRCGPKAATEWGLASGKFDVCESAGARLPVGCDGPRVASVGKNALMRGSYLTVMHGFVRCASIAVYL